MFLGSLVAHLVKNPPAMWETSVRFLGREDPLEKGTSPVFWPEEFHGLYSLCGHKESDTTEHTCTHAEESLSLMGAVRCNEIAFKGLAKCTAQNRSIENGPQD